MDEATGSTAMLYILLVFLAVYVMFIAIAVNYARAFKTKNKIIDIIEQNQGIKNISDSSDDAIVGIETYLDEIHYNIQDNNIDNEDNKYGTCFERGYCVKKNNGINGGHYYKVTTFIMLKVPLIDSLTFEIPVMGETIEMGAIS